MQISNGDDATHTLQNVLHNVEALAQKIKDSADVMEAERCLPSDLARALMEAGVFRLGVPSAYGGPQLDPMGQVRVVEELSRLNGSVGWLSMIGSAASFMAAFLAPPVAQRLFGDTYSVAAGQLRPPQRADVVEGGYRVSGTWHFASGCQHATVLVCGSTVYENGQPRLLPSGQPETRVVLVPASAATIIDIWHTTGMRGTGSNDFRVENVFAPFEDSPDMTKPPHCPGALYAFPPLFLVSHAGVPLGIARGALDFIEELSGQKEMLPSRHLLREDSQVQETVAWAEASLSAARSYVYSTLEDLWETLSRGDKPSPHQRTHYRLMITYSHQAAKDIVAKLYDIAATSAIFRTSPLDRCMRDILTACQHRVVHQKMYRPAGRLLLGLNPEELFF